MTPDRQRAVERLTALWALSEAGLGGFLHAMKTPFSGTVISSVAIMIICLIADYSDRKSLAILKAVTIVLIIKVAISPYSPLTASFAVCFQAAAGAILFSVISRFRVASLLLGIVSLVECALQRIIFLTVLYGNSLWESINIFVGYLTRQLGISQINSDFSPSFLLITLYLFVYSCAGIAAGLLGGSLPNAVKEAMKSETPLASKTANVDDFFVEGSKPRKPPSKRKLLHYGAWILFIVASLTFLAPVAHDAARGVSVFLRTVIVLLAWYFLVAPVLMNSMRKLLKNKEIGYGRDIRTVLDLFPHLKEGAKQVWVRSGEKKGFAWGWHFLIAMIVFTLNFEGMSSRSTSRIAVGVQKQEKTDTSMV